MNLQKALFSAAVICLAAFPAAGQSSARDFETVRSFNPALDFSNAAGLSFLPKEDNISKINLFFEKGNGDLIGIDGSSDCWVAGTNTESFQRVSDRMAFHGKLSYSYSRLKNSGGPVLLDILYNPLNFYESDPSVVGKRKIESYSLEGGLSYALNDNLSLGLNTAYTSSDRTKYKDPRFLNEWMDADVSTGLMWSPDERFSIGTAVEYRHTLEQLSAGTFGTKDRDFYIYVDQGGFLGISEPFEGDDGYVSTSNARPMANNYFGGSIQIVHGDVLKFYHEIRGFLRKGYYGTKSSSTVQFSENSGPEATYSLTALAHKGDNIHRFGLFASWQKTENYINSYSYKTEEGRSTVVVYNGRNKQLDRNDLRASISYKGSFGVSGVRPSFETGLSVNGFARLQKTTIYPIWREQDIICADADLFAAKNTISGQNIFSPRIDLLFHTGFGTAARDGEYAASTSKNKSFDEYLNPQFEYFTANRAGASISFTYTRVMTETYSVYVEVADTFNTLLATPEYLSGRTRNIAVLSFGLNF